ncbi:hypothetical protein [Aureibacter tunicatorum]|uniref:PKD domain-containing protein n=1 Tax=Aureibacter tunicatorum TaxID=866807 RepID=A0AAE3XUL8_9BACT|nr:hypothetical protein [Aureibacter tunicatorum]MDR6242014.1 hypothetical protein [Aureibacter tunicatorum]BDD07141.1 hypothetical protein AUTU_46240 [Aureibacter tunicatorum]
MRELYLIICLTFITCQLRSQGLMNVTACDYKDPVEVVTPYYIVNGEKIEGNIFSMDAIEDNCPEASEHGVSVSPTPAGPYVMGRHVKGIQNASGDYESKYEFEFYENFTGQVQVTVVSTETGMCSFTTQSFTLDVVYFTGDILVRDNDQCNPYSFYDTGITPSEEYYEVKIPGKTPYRFDWNTDGTVEVVIDEYNWCRGELHAIQINNFDAMITVSHDITNGKYKFLIHDNYVGKISYTLSSSDKFACDFSETDQEFEIVHNPASGERYKERKIEFSFDYEIKSVYGFCSAEVEFTPKNFFVDHYEYNDIIWDFGDGNCTTGDVNEVITHIYDIEDQNEFNVVAKIPYWTECGELLYSEVLYTVQEKLIDIDRIFPDVRQVSIKAKTYSSDKILSASASTFSDSWPLDMGVGLAHLNEFESGASGVWRTSSAYVYENHGEQRQSTGPINEASPDISADGTFSLNMFDWQSFDPEMVPGWIRANQMLKYNGYGYETDNVNALGIYSGALYGYFGQKALAVGQNMRSEEMGYTGFEEALAGEVNFPDNQSWISGRYAEPNDGGNFDFGRREQIEWHEFKVVAHDKQTILVEITEEQINEIESRVVLVGIKNGIPVLLYADMHCFSAKDDPATKYYIFVDNPTLAYFDNVIAMHGQKMVPESPEISLTRMHAHTGERSLMLVNGVDVFWEQRRIKLAPGKKYLISAWVADSYSVQGYEISSELGIEMEFYDRLNNQIGSYAIAPKGNVIDGWQKIEGDFTAPDGIEMFKIRLVAAGEVYYDDLRIHPYQGNMQTYVYDLQTDMLKAVLDQNNYATYYHYDDELNLKIVQKETEKGVMTIEEHNQYRVKTK